MSDTTQTLPKLRSGLRILKGPNAKDGAPTWTIHDTARNAYFRIGWTEFELLSHWNKGHAKAILDHVTNTTTLTPDIEELKALYNFLQNHQLLELKDEESQQDLKDKYVMARSLKWMDLMKYYIFFRMPLFQPDAFLNWLMPMIRPALSRTALYVFGLMAALSLFLILRDWHNFTHTFSYFFTFEGIVISVITIFLLQMFHEMGHAIAAKYYGLKVPTIGVAFIVMIPLLYTDTTTSWELTSKRKRFMIGAAGILMETALAILATLAWAVLPDGIPRSIAFMIATIAWISSLLINLVPFMRFDGYYLLSDATGYDNLAPRSFNMSRWWLRRTILGDPTLAPEILTRREQTFMILFGFATWIYRFVLFLGIALAVYHFYFKLLGIALMVIEIYYFIARPIIQELAIWWKIRGKLVFNRNMSWSLATVTALVIFLAVPWQTSIETMAILRADNQQTLYPPQSAQIISVNARNGQQVKAGETLFVLQDKEKELQLAQARLELIRAQRIIASAATNALWREDATIARENREKALSQIKALEREIARLTITAPFDGQIKDLGSEIKPGRWVNSEEKLARIMTPNKKVIETYVTERNFTRIQNGAPVRFFTSHTGKTVAGDVKIIDKSATNILQTQALSSFHNGDIAVEKDNDGRYVPHEAIYRVLIGAKNAPDLEVVERGWVEIAAERKSIGQTLFENAASIVIRESSF